MWWRISGQLISLGAHPVDAAASGPSHREGVEGLLSVCAILETGCRVITVLVQDEYYHCTDHNSALFI